MLHIRGRKLERGLLEVQFCTREMRSLEAVLLQEESVFILHSYNKVLQSHSVYTRHCFRVMSRVMNARSCSRSD